MARLIVNKHFDKHNDAANGFSTEQEYAFGEIIICNDKETPSIYIKDKENNSIGISNVKVINEDKILSKTNGGELYTSLEMVWDNINHQIKLYGNDKNNPISTIDIFGEDNIANDINKSIERVVDITAVKYTYENVPTGLKPNRDYFKISVFNDNIETTQYLPYVKEEIDLNGYLKENALESYAQKSWVTEKITETVTSGTVDLSEYASIQYVDEKFVKTEALNAYATQEWIDEKGFITSIPDEYVTESGIEAYNFVKDEVLNAYATQEWVNGKGFITSIPDEYATQNWVTDTALNGYIKKGDETEYILSAATENNLGGIKVGYQSNDMDRMYGVKVDDDGNAYVNIPWVEIKDYLSSTTTVPSNLHYVPTETSNTYTAEDGKYISGIKYDEKKHITDIVETSLPTVAETAKSLDVNNVGTDTKPVKFVGGIPQEVEKEFLTGITNNDVVTALGFTPLSAETKYNGSTFINVDSNTISAITGDTANTLAVGNHSHDEQYQLKGDYIEDSELGTLTFESGNFETTSFKANGNCTVKVPTSTAHITNDSNYITSGDISLSIEGKGCLTGGGTITNGESVEISHETKTVILSNGVSTLDNSGEFVVQTIEYDDYGHINKLHETTYTLNVTLDDIGAAPETHGHDINEIDGVDDKIASYLAINDAMIFKGTITGENSFPQTFEAGWTYKVATADTYFGQKFEVGDMVIAVKDATSITTTSSNFTTYWAVVQTNTDGIVIGPSESVSGNIPVFDNATGKLIKDSGISINDVLTEETFKGTVTAVNINGVTKQPNNDGVVELGSYLTGFTESDPIFTQSAAYCILDSDIATWNNKIDNTYCYSKDEVNGLLQNINDSDENVKVSNNTTDTIYLIGVTTTGETTDGTVKNNNIYIQNNVLTAPNGTFETLSTDNLTVDSNITVHGIVSGATAYYQGSDERLKDFGEDIDVDFNKLKEIPKKYFTWKSDDTKKVDLGTSAQKVRELYPELVGGDDDTTLSVDYAKLSIVALKAVDKLHEENEMLRAELDMIKKHLGL